METNQTQQQDVVKLVYEYAAKLLLEEKKSEREVEQILIKDGIDAQTAKLLVQTISGQITSAKKDQAGKDMLYGALWCIGGIIATVADFGFIFWGAIVFGAIQFFRGVANS
jgi:hypothetical protein